MVLSFYWMHRIVCFPIITRTILTTWNTTDSFFYANQCWLIAKGVNNVALADIQTFIWISQIRSLITFAFRRSRKGVKICNSYKSSITRLIFTIKLLVRRNRMSLLLEAQLGRVSCPCYYWHNLYTTGYIMFGNIIFSSISTLKIWTGTLMLKIFPGNVIAGYIALI